MAGELLTPEQRQQIEQLLSEDLSDSLQRRAQIMLFYDEGQPTCKVAQAAGRSRGRARYWRRQFWSRGMSIFPITSPEASPVPAVEGDSMAIPFETLPTEPVLPEASQELPASIDPVPVQESQPLPPAGAGLEGMAVRISPREPGPLDPSSLPEFLSQFKDLKSSGVQPDDPLVEAARKVLRFHFIEMLRHEAGTRTGEDIEDLHDMRVATRRMRAAFDIFGDSFKPKVLKNRLKGLRATGRALGRVRDLDVFIEKAHRYLDGLPEGERQGLTPILQLWESDRASARDQMLIYLDSPDYKAFKKKFFGFVSTPGAGALSIPQIGPTPSLVREVAPVLVYSRVAAVRAFAPILPSASLEQLHELRIEFKKLRYTFEFFREVLGAEIKAVINDLKGLQDHLGDLNDAQVATQILSRFLVDWDPRQAGLPIGDRQNPEPVVAYLAYQHSERYRLMTTFGEAWSCFDNPEFKRNLALAVSVL